MKLIKKIADLIPDIPNKRYGIYCGTNSVKDLLVIIKLIFKMIFFHKKIENKRKFTKKFNEKFSQFTNQKYCLSYGSGRMALYSILKTMNIKEGDQVLLPAFTCTVVPNAIIYAGAKPVYVDIDPQNFNINTKLIEKKITKKTIAIYVQHTFGVKCDMIAINKLAKKKNLKIIEDNAHYFDQKSEKNLSVYASFYSLDHSKIINTHLGGIAATNNLKVYESLKKDHKNLFILPKLSQLRILLSFLIEIIIFSPFFLWIGRSIFQVLYYFKIIFYFRDELDNKKPSYYPCNYNEYLAIIGIDQITNLEKNLRHRAELSLYFEKKIKWYQFDETEMSNNSWLRYSFLVKDRKKFLKLFKKKFNLDVWYTSIFEGRDKNYEDIQYKLGSCPAAEYVSKHIVNFPTHLNISKKVYEKFFEKNWEWIKNEIDYNTLIERKI